MAIFLATDEPRVAGGHEWTAAGPEGAIAVEESIAFKLLRELPRFFTVVEEPVKKAVKAVEEAEHVIVAEVEAAVEKAAPKRRTATTKE
jgi:hypothetical protein